MDPQPAAALAAAPSPAQPPALPAARPLAALRLAVHGGAPMAAREITILMGDIYHEKCWFMTLLYPN